MVSGLIIRSLIPFEFGFFSGCVHSMFPGQKLNIHHSNNQSHSSNTISLTQSATRQLPIEFSLNIRKCFYYFTCSCPVFQHHLLKWYVVLCHRLIDDKSINLFLGFLCSSINLCVCFCDSTILF